MGLNWLIKKIVYFYLKVTTKLQTNKLQSFKQLYFCNENLTKGDPFSNLKLLIESKNWLMLRYNLCRFYETCFSLCFSLSWYLPRKYALSKCTPCQYLQCIIFLRSFVWRTNFNAPQSGSRSTCVKGIHLNVSWMSFHKNTEILDYIPYSFATVF